MHPLRSSSHSSYSVPDSPIDIDFSIVLPETEPDTCMDDARCHVMASNRFEQSLRPFDKQSHSSNKKKRFNFKQLIIVSQL